MYWHSASIQTSPLAEARRWRDDARKTPAAGRDPVAERKIQAILAQENTFEAVARRWFETTKAQWTEVHAGDVIHSLGRDVFPKIGPMPVNRRAVLTPNGALSSCPGYDVWGQSLTPNHMLPFRSDMKARRSSAANIRGCSELHLERTSRHFGNLPRSHALRPECHSFFSVIRSLLQRIQWHKPDIYFIAWDGIAASSPRGVTCRS